MQPGVGVVGCQMEYVGTAGRSVGALSGEPTEGRRQDIADARFNPFAASSMVAHAELLRSLGGFDADLVRWAGPVDDLDLLSRVVRSGREVVTVPLVLGRYRVHPKAASAKEFFRMQRASRFLNARVLAQKAGRDLSWEEYLAFHPVPWRHRVRDRGHYYYRAAGMNLVNDRHFHGALYLVGAVALTPKYTALRLLQQKGWRGFAN
jgi:hypothetical protein